MSHHENNIKHFVKCFHINKMFFWSNEVREKTGRYIHAHRSRQTPFDGDGEYNTDFNKFKCGWWGFRIFLYGLWVLIFVFLLIENAIDIRDKVAKNNEMWKIWQYAQRIV